MVHVHDLIGEVEHKLIARWASAVLQDGGVLDDKTHDRIASFLRELRAALASAVSENKPSLPRESEPESEEPEGGVDMVLATRAFGALHGLLLEMAADRGVVILPVEQVTLASHVTGAICRAAALDRRQHDREAWRAAHQLRNPLGSAMMALTLLRSRVDFGADGRLVDTLERSLKRIQGLIEETTQAARLEDGTAEAGAE